MPERFRVVCIPYKALYKCLDLPFTFTLLTCVVIFIRYVTYRYGFSLRKNVAVWFTADPVSRPVPPYFQP